MQDTGPSSLETRVQVPSPLPCESRHAAATRSLFTDGRWWWVCPECGIMRAGTGDAEVRTPPRSMYRTAPSEGADRG
jgi:hypothetical protein